MNIKEFHRKKYEILQKFKGKRIGVLCGGTSREREVSIRSGNKIFSALKKIGLNAKLIIIEGDFVGEILKEKIDVAFVIFHGKPGEDGKVQGFLELLKIPYTGSGVLASSCGMNKIISKKIFIASGIPTPPAVFIYRYENIEEKIKEIKKIGLPVIIKPKDEGSSIGVEIVKEENNLKEIIERKREEYKDIIVEKYIKGKIVTTGVLGTGKEAFALPVLELRPLKREFYDYYAKYTKGETEFIIPAELEKETYKKLQEYSVMAHKVLECRGFSRVDGVVSEKNEIYILEVNTLPGMTDLSDLPAEAEKAGLSYEDLVLFILNTIFDENY